MSGYDWFDDEANEYYAEQEKQAEASVNALLRRAQKLRPFVQSEIYQEVKKDLFDRFIYATPKIDPASPNPEKQAYAVFLKQQGIRHFFDMVEAPIKQAELVEANM